MTDFGNIVNQAFTSSINSMKRPFEELSRTTEQLPNLGRAFQNSHMLSKENILPNLAAGVRAASGQISEAFNSMKDTIGKGATIAREGLDRFIPKFTLDDLTPHKYTKTANPVSNNWISNPGRLFKQLSSMNQRFE